jgi:hypothetical protein
MTIKQSRKTLAISPFSQVESEGNVINLYYLSAALRIHGACSPKRHILFSVGHSGTLDFIMRLASETKS